MELVASDRGGLVETEGDGKWNVDHHVQPQDLERVEGMPPAMAKMPAPMNTAI